MSEQTEAEDKAGVVPVDVSYQPGDIRRYGGKPDGSANNAKACQAMIDLGQPVPYAALMALRKALEGK